MKILFKRIKTMTFILLSLCFGILLISGMVLIILSPGKPRPFRDADGTPLPGSLSEKIFMQIGGVQQGMFIKSKNTGNPVLLYLHGGMPDYFLTAHYPTGLEDDFTVVWWEQRGFGISFDPESDPGCLNTEQMLSDIKSLTDSLRTRFGQEKIYLMGRSGGTYTGIQAAARYPECFHAYIGIGQMTDQLESEKQAYTFMLQRYREAGNIRWVKRLEAVPVVETIPAAYLKLRDPAMHSLGIGTTRTMRSVARELFLPSLTFREYMLREKIRFWRAKARSGVHPLWEEILRTSMIQKVNHLEIPVYFLHGRYDYTVSYSLAREYYEALEAPVKAFFTFENSAHSPHMEEPQKTREILRTHILKQNPAGLQ